MEKAEQVNAALFESFMALEKEAAQGVLSDSSTDMEQETGRGSSSPGPGSPHVPPSPMEPPAKLLLSFINSQESSGNLYHNNV